jgi:two-component system, NarL family, nitrate/nitrite response regulator NarL
MAFQTQKEQAIKNHQHFVTYDPALLLRHLIEQIVPDSPLPQAKAVRRTSEGIEEVLFELDIDGIRYIVIRSQPQPAAEQVNLSPRELAIAQLIAKGLPNKAIGEFLEISQWTVATHLRRIFIKLGVTSRAAMVARILEESVL